MTKKIIKRGLEEFHGTCPACRCEFTYDLDDVRTGLFGKLTHGDVSCPSCGERIPHFRSVSL